MGDHGLDGARCPQQFFGGQIPYLIVAKFYDIVILYVDIYISIHDCFTLPTLKALGLEETWLQNCSSHPPPLHREAQVCIER